MFLPLPLTILPANPARPPNALLVPSTVPLNVGEDIALPVALSRPAPAGGVDLAVSSGQPSVAAANVIYLYVPEGQTAPSRGRLTAFSRGLATVTVSAPGYPSVSFSIPVN
ncbi:MAG: hypothetical protein K2X03_22875 [Bryobacteraceae bacterium]|nr:hypothetical protein [Bryobacteraceae bacterium]